MSILLYILKRSVTPWKRYMGFGLGEPERIYNIHVPIMSRTAAKIVSILLYILKRSVTPWKRYMRFSLGEPVNHRSMPGKTSLTPPKLQAHKRYNLVGIISIQWKQLFLHYSGISFTKFFAKDFSGTNPCTLKRNCKNCAFVKIQPRINWICKQLNGNTFSCPKCF